MTGFEPAAPSSRTRYSTKLSHIPKYNKPSQEALLLTTVIILLLDFFIVNHKTAKNAGFIYFYNNLITA